MSDVEKRIIALLSEGPKRYKELKQVVVDKDRLCANQTLSGMLKGLARDGKVTKELRADRSTIYTLSPSCSKKGATALDIITMEKLIGQLDSVFREESLIEIKPSEKRSKWWEEFLEKIQAGGYEHKPKLRFSFYLDEKTKEIADLFLRTGEVSAELQGVVGSVLRKIRESLPSRADKGSWRLEISGWNDGKNFAERLKSAFGMSAAVLAFYDGKEYRENLTNSLRQLRRLESKHEVDIEFLDEIAARCKAANEVYCHEEVFDKFYDTTLPDLRVLKDIYSILDEAFWWYCLVSDTMHRPALEVALISSAIAELGKKGTEIPTANVPSTGHCAILDYDAYFKMKVQTLTENDKNKILKFMLLSALAEIKNPEEYNQGRDWTIFPDEYSANILKLGSKVEAAEVKIGDKGLPELPKLENDPVLDFKFHFNDSILDFSAEPVVLEFKDYLTEHEKREWLQKCLNTGLPLLAAVPFKELGFKVQWII